MVPTTAATVGYNGSGTLVVLQDPYLVKLYDQDSGLGLGKVKERTRSLLACILAGYRCRREHLGAPASAVTRDLNIGRAWETASAMCTTVLSSTSLFLWPPLLVFVQL